MSFSAGAAARQAPETYEEIPNCLASVQELGTAFFQKVVLAETIVPLMSLPSTEPGLHHLPHADDSLKPHHTQLSSPPKLFQVVFPYEWHYLAHASDFPKISQTSIWPQHAPYLSPSGLRPGTNNNQPQFAAGPHLGTSKPIKSSSHLQINLYAKWSWEGHRWQLTLAYTS